MGISNKFPGVVLMLLGQRTTARGEGVLSIISRLPLPQPQVPAGQASSASSSPRGFVCLHFPVTKPYS